MNWLNAFRITLRNHKRLPLYLAIAGLVVEYTGKYFAITAINVLGIVMLAVGFAGQCFIGFKK